MQALRWFTIAVAEDKAMFKLLSDPGTAVTVLARKLCIIAIE
jgi:hypothetical protein